ncbi:phage shock protein A (PspA) family protein [Vibrio xiamenensis]|uniref:Phage shock protein A (PspA) family protein n=1 Tax=Vibrio xiamenensis TaxID=861298 RepID=A0A1G8A0H1_9VIBR|nr:PspA/IM30 family protein [Vibrio xiamenensis]SDH14445.1 phage shock protein A (PspA) family protein [Vibrio xiamenensis]
MGLFNTLSTIFKSKTNEADEAIWDANAVSILTQHIREAKADMIKADGELVNIIADRKMADTKVSEIEKNVSKYEQHAITANQQGNAELALECAQKVTQLRNDLTGAKDRQTFYINAESKMRQNLKSAKDRLEQLESQVDIVKANEAVQKAQEATLKSVNGSTSKVTTAMESLERIQKKQDRHQARMDAAGEMASSASSLDERLSQAGLVGGNSSAEDELARILGQTK